MLIPADVFIDPPPAAASFQAEAKVILTVESGAAYDYIHEVIRVIEASSWKESKLSGYPRACWRIAGPWGETPLEFLVSEEDATVCFKGTWYLVYKVLITKLVDDFIKLTISTAAKRPNSGRSRGN